MFNKLNMNVCDNISLRFNFNKLMIKIVKNFFNKMKLFLGWCVNLNILKLYNLVY